MASLPPPTQRRTIDVVAGLVEDFAFIAVLVSAVALCAAIVILAFAL
jgi:hypothetical protein